MTIYQEHGFENRREYLQDLADQFGVEEGVVFQLASFLGKDEDFDGLVSELANM